MGPAGLPGPATVALVMPAHRAGDDFEASLRSVTLLDPAPDEVVVVVDGGDPVVVRQVDGRCAVVEIPSSGPAAARNAGAAATTADIVLFVDSDVVVGPGLVAAVRVAMATDLRTLVGACDAGSPPDAIVGSYDDRPGASTTVSQFRNLLHHWTHQRSAGPAHTFWGACGAVRRSVFDAVDGFDERFRDATIEDIEFGERVTSAGFRIDLVPSIQVTHLKRWTLASMIQTDFAKRGVPWSRLILQNRSMPDDLNTDRVERVNVALTGVLAVSLIGSLLRRVPTRTALVVALAVASGLAWRDRPFLRFLAQRRSTAFALRSFPLLVVHRLCAGIAFGWAVATWPVARRVDA